MIELSPEIEQALGENQAIVALETTLICHGLPYPDNLETAKALEAIVRAEGAVPATIGLLGGKVKIGLTPSELEQLATDRDVLKCSTRDISKALSLRAAGATTVASTIYLANKAGIRFMATGGLGGVHRGGELSMDISADIGELARSASVVVCSGAKAILDLQRTMEALESAGVAIFGFGTDWLPGFYIERTEFPVPIVKDIAQIVTIVEAQAAIGWPGSIVIANPPPADLAMTTEEFEQILSKSLDLAREQNISGGEVTPFLLAEIARKTEHRSVGLNKGLVLQNAELAARIAVRFFTPNSRINNF